MNSSNNRSFVGEMVNPSSLEAKIAIPVGLVSGVAGGTAIVLFPEGLYQSLSTSDQVSQLQGDNQYLHRLEGKARTDDHNQAVGFLKQQATENKQTIASLEHHHSAGSSYAEQAGTFAGSMLAGAVFLNAVATGVIRIRRARQARALNTEVTQFLEKQFPAP